MKSRRLSSPTRIRLGLAAGALGLGLLGASPAAADETVYACTSNAGLPAAGRSVMQGTATYGINWLDTCAGNEGLQLLGDGVNATHAGQTASWLAHAPAGLSIANGQVDNWAVSGAQGTGKVAAFVWDGTEHREADGAGEAASGSGFSTGTIASSTFGFVLRCAGYAGTTTCPAQVNNQSGRFTASNISLTVREVPGAGPGFLRLGGLPVQSGWVRGAWPVAFGADSASGVCAESASLDGLALPGSVTTSPAGHQDSWKQCGAPDLTTTVDTTKVRQGAVPLVLTASDAAGASGTWPRTVLVDNTSPTVALSGPTDAPSTAGTQYVTATGTDPLSGVASLSCSVDGATPVTYAGAGAQVPVQGIGQHTIRCTAANSAVDPAGNHGVSAPATWSLKIGAPTVSAIAFSRLVDALRCRRVRERVLVPARTILVTTKSGRVPVHERAHSVVVRVMRCRPRTTHRRITTFAMVRRHGRLVRVKRVRLVKIVLAPHTASFSSQRVPFGRGTTVNGWLGRSDGTALAGQVVRVLTAPMDGHEAFSQVTSATTAADGSWSAQLPAGPSRLVMAAYDGGPATEGSGSLPARLIVPARVTMRIAPRVTPWGSTIRITGHVLGGYVPASSQLLRLNVGIGRLGHLVGLPEIRSDGRFTLRWKFNAGHGIVRPWFSVGTLPEANYPYAPGTSRRVYVTVGRAVPVRHHGHHHRRHRAR